MNLKKQLTKESFNALSRRFPWADFSDINPIQMSTVMDRMRELPDDKEIFPEGKAETIQTLENMVKAWT